MTMKALNIYGPVVVCSYYQDDRGHTWHVNRENPNAPGIKLNSYQEHQRLITAAAAHLACMGVRWGTNPLLSLSPQDIWDLYHDEVAA